LDEPWDGPPEVFDTPGIRTIAALADFADFAPPERQIKSLVYMVAGTPTLLLLRGDHELMEQKVVDGLEAPEVRPAHEEEIVALMGAHAGSLGAVGLVGMRIVADPALEGRVNMTTGANQDDKHLRGVDMSRDIAVDRWLEMRTVAEGEACPDCGEPLAVRRSIEVGHIFKLGTTYSTALSATVLDEAGEERELWMGSYGIGVGRNVAAIVETHHDDKGIVWPASVAPYEVVVTAVSITDDATVEAATGIYDELRAAGIEVLFDDRDERPGVKFADAELIGIPYRCTVGPRGLADGNVEVVRRRDGTTEVVDVDTVVDHIRSIIEAEQL
jgi:prolyl-tRNA synthetase